MYDSANGTFTATASIVMRAPLATRPDISAMSDGPTRNRTDEIMLSPVPITSGAYCLARLRGGTSKHFHYGMSPLREYPHGAMLTSKFFSWCFL